MCLSRGKVFLFMMTCTVCEVCVLFVCKWYKTCTSLLLEIYLWMWKVFYLFEILFNPGCGALCCLWVCFLSCNLPFSGLLCLLCFWKRESQMAVHLTSFPDTKTSSAMWADEDPPATTRKLPSLPENSVHLFYTSESRRWVNIYSWTRRKVLLILVGGGFL